ncbi:uncharacterized protein LOC18440632 [Amborella trichopoda]|uniref:uncharacterized protein LOC18440632 n=1 Tax=Amborella trichopoda TaxID=13333 RepID=UPI0005D2EE95|nr:uncharacterized protein LOC18440632 [Amborella trichopoda]XP_020527041.1 uncharacterized protein LOC18440632 [Amborella trichopoda]XP_020527042.1 uncharacterized protein LOC18440632 [Amborella trichopoda]XP_020527043.1 uncharacterized protein LOC18440632 [Amborella trichopoda]XP_020527044.1 uncharacterized protein LOC18440632 [Amborella trichopoda]XP_020527045.1 uncharacterized protein LOC18440632 [Amborella trichopoda]XP_020527046.1 uncharacterized protein LOC18440632 [Amborella trichopod|eukprot:XP_006850833.2 uncharacterized protein LOC18440632 [Amborella trichopoda]
MAVSRLREAGLPLMNLLKLRGKPILEQLQLEERLLRTSSDNWCIINDGTNTPTIVMGISGKPSQLIEIEPVIRDRIHVIRRFSGGGTVIVDKGTVFVTFICDKDAIPGLQPYPHPIMSWTGQLYSTVFQGIPDFQLRENDYAFGNRKFGGNAQSITKGRWIHHTSFLWEYDIKNMEYLKLPVKAPKYRSERHHGEFLCQLKDFPILRSDFIEKAVSSIGSYFSVEPVELKEILASSDAVYPHTTKLLALNELQAFFPEVT